MKKIVTFLIVLVATATASASPYNTELLADPSFESREGPWGLYYWNEGNSLASTLVTDTDTDNPYYVAGSQQRTGLYSIEIDAGANVGQSFSVNDDRNTNNNFNSTEGVSFTAVNIQNVSYSAGDTVSGSLWVNIDNWSGAGGNAGVGFRLVGSTGNAFIENSPRLASTTGWEQVDLSFNLAADYSGVLRFDVIFDAGDTGGRAWVDDASMSVIPEPSSLILGLCAFIAAGVGMIRRRR